MSKKQLQKKSKEKEKPVKARGKPGPKPKVVLPEKLPKGYSVEDIDSEVAGGPKTPKRRGRKPSIPADQRQLAGDDADDLQDSHRKSRRKATVASSLETEKKLVEATKRANQVISLSFSPGW